MAAGTGMLVVAGAPGSSYVGERRSLRMASHHHPVHCFLNRCGDELAGGVRSKVERCLVWATSARLARLYGKEGRSRVSARSF